MKVFATPTRPARKRILGICVLVAMLAWAGVAAAIQVTTPVTQLSDAAVGATSTYAFSGYRTDGSDSQARPLVWVEVTFGPETDVTGAVAVAPNTTVTRSGQTVRVTFNPRVPADTDFQVVIGGIINPGTAGTYSVGDIACYTTNNGGRQPRTEYVPTAPYTITAAGILTLTVVAPDPGNSIDFGAVDPGVQSGPKDVVVTVESSSPYTVSRAVDGDDDLMGLSASGLPSETQSPGTGVFTDTFVLDPPWTSEPGIAYSAQITYTVVQQ